MESSTATTAPTLGADLNRSYADPTHDESPSTFATMAVARQLHGRKELYAYVDAHAHANKRGCFLYANPMESDVDRREAALFAELVALNSRYFDLSGCSWRQAGAHKGSGRAAVYALTHLPLVFTLECNYDSGASVNRRPPRHVADDETDGGTKPAGRLSPEPPADETDETDLKYTPAAWREVGQALALAVLDMAGANPASRLGPLGGEGLERMRAASSWFAEYAEGDDDDDG